MKSVKMLSEQVFVLTGCASGIGKHMATVLANAGARVMMTDINVQALDQAVAQYGWDNDRIKTAALDVRDPEGWTTILQNTVQHWGQIDVLMNIAGVVQTGKIPYKQADQIDFHIDINLKGTLYGCNAIVPILIQQGHGHIINIASVAGHIPVPGLSLYSASKFGVRGFSHAIAADLKPHGISVSVLCPDAVATPMLDAEADMEDSEFVFAGTHILTVEEIEYAILNRILPKAPTEVILPTASAWLAKLFAVAPIFSTRITPLFRSKGLKNRIKYKNNQ